MRLLSFYPTRAFFHPGQTVTLKAEIETEVEMTAELCLTITHLADPPVEIRETSRLMPGRQRVRLAWQPVPTFQPAGGGEHGSSIKEPAGYGALLWVRPEHLAAGPVDEPGLQATTAFDILPSWTCSPRYGFVSDFAPDRADFAGALDALLPYHINGLQFYDWQYRHDSLLPPQEEYLDPLNRPLSLATVQGLIDAAHERSMAALPYLAVYAASAGFWRNHPDWALYDAEGRPIPFGEDFLGLMNPASGNSWPAHLLEECERALAALPFDGLHIDQYGDPKQAWDRDGRAVDLPAAFANFVAAARQRFPGRAVVFNAVGNWPIEALTAAPADFEYIEAWPPRTGFSDLADLVINARSLSAGRPVVIAVYLPADQPANVLMAEAIIYAAGGTRIELGEAARLLADPYFPKHQALPDELARQMRLQADFAVRYGAWTGPAADYLPELEADAGPEAWLFARAANPWTVLHLVNHRGLGLQPRWDEPQPFPAPQVNLPVRLRLAEPPRRVFWAAPERPTDGLQPLDFEYTGGVLSVQIPRLENWTIVACER
jgi:dextranase